MKIKQTIKSLLYFFKKKNIISILTPVDQGNLLHDKVCLIIGGTGGIGLSIAKSFVSSGCKVIVTGTNENKYNEQRKNFTDKEKNEIKFILLDLNNIDLFEEKINTITNIYGKIDILVNSAGVHTENVNFFSVTPNEYDRVFDINLKGVFFISQVMANYFMKNKIKGHILMISSSRGSEPAWSPYGITKWGLNGFVKGLSQQLLPYGIIVNSISPGVVATPLLGFKEGDNLYSEENMNYRLILPEEIAIYAKLLVSDLGNMIVGETIHISGGRGIFDIR